MYEKTVDGLRCPLHDVRFADDAECSRCTAIRSQIAVAEQSTSSVEIDAELTRLADDAIGFSKYLHRVSRERIEDGNPNDWNAAAKLIAEGTKLARFGTDLKGSLSARAHSRYLVEHEKDVRGLRRKGN